MTASIADLLSKLSDSQKAALLHAGWAGFGYSAGALKAQGRPSTIARLNAHGFTRNGILTALGRDARAYLVATEWRRPEETGATGAGPRGAS